MTENTQEKILNVLWKPIDFKNFVKNLRKNLAVTFTILTSIITIFIQILLYVYQTVVLNYYHINHFQISLDAGKILTQVFISIIISVLILFTIWMRIVLEKNRALYTLTFFCNILISLLCMSITTYITNNNELVNFVVFLIMCFIFEELGILYFNIKKFYISLKNKFIKRKKEDNNCVPNVQITPLHLILLTFLIICFSIAFFGIFAYQNVRAKKEYLITADNYTLLLCDKDLNCVGTQSVIQKDSLIIPDINKQKIINLHDVDSYYNHKFKSIELISK